MPVSRPTAAARRSGMAAMVASASACIFSAKLEPLRITGLIGAQ